MATKPKARKRAAEAPTKRRLGVAHVPTPENRVLVQALTSVGATAEETAFHMGVHRATLFRHYAEELQNGTRFVHQRIALGVTQRALKGDNAASFFILKTRAGWRETHDLNHRIHEPASTLDDARLEAIARTGGRAAAASKEMPD